MIGEQPYFLTNEKWYYFDEEEWGYKLTDEAPDEAIASYKEFYEDEDEALERDAIIRR